MTIRPMTMNRDTLNKAYTISGDMGKMTPICSGMVFVTAMLI